MKLTPEARLEIFAIFQNAMLKGGDASQGMRELDFEPTAGGELKLTQEYIDTHPRATFQEFSSDESVN